MLHCVFEGVFMLLGKETTITVCSYGAYLQRFIQQSERNCTVQPQDVTHTALRFPQCERRQ